MAQPNVVREPSMDEILASIRRIIESNEPASQPGIATPTAEPQGFSGYPANDDSDEVTLTVDNTFADDVETDTDFADIAPPLRADIESMPHKASEKSSPAPQKSLSLADVAARVRAASERNSLSLRDPSSAPPIAESRPLSPAVTGEHTWPSDGAEAEHHQPAPPSSASAAVARIGERFESDLQQSDRERSEDERAASQVPLVSSSTGEQVARSFQDLALAVNDAERRSFDEIASDLLRPMLQEWLDDNLPTLVERLVREEIERVARGPRR